MITSLPSRDCPKNSSTCRNADGQLNGPQEKSLGEGLFSSPFSEIDYGHRQLTSSENGRNHHNQTAGTTAIGVALRRQMVGRCRAIGGNNGPLCLFPRVGRRSCIGCQFFSCRSRGIQLYSVTRFRNGKITGRVKRISDQRSATCFADRISLSYHKKLASKFVSLPKDTLHEFGNISNDVQRRQDARSGRLSHRLFSGPSTAAAADGRRWRWQIVGPGQILLSEPIRRPVHRSHQPRGGHRWQWAGEADGRAHHLGGSLPSPPSVALLKCSFVVFQKSLPGKFSISF
ncbi:uncharacterized protein LOC124190698 [Daphnia pulex]|uniref:uncharacterized protein LOC124190698 n=1 Tax=Daphnia pulex TaxID=6669 RepID=UPI001EE0CC07|nr:uncharacterized protein LOC124190698 [Daphnia pulex]